MPKLLAYLPCEKVVTEQGSNNVSIISLLETINVIVPPNAPPPPPNSVIPIAWTIFSLWQREEGDTGEFQCKSVVTSPNGETLLEGSPARWRFENANFRQQIIEKITGFPIWTPGPCQIKMNLKKPGDSDFHEVLSAVIVLQLSPPA